MTMPALLAALLLIAPTTARAAAPCLTPADAQTLVRFALPLAIDASIERCRPLLPATSHMARAGAALAARYRGAFNEPVAAVLPAFEKLSGKAMPEGISAETMGGLIRDTIGQMIREKLKPGDCGAVDDLMRVLDPLPPANAAELTVMLLRLGAKDDPKLGICR